MSSSGLVIRRACANDADNIITAINSVAAEGCWLLTKTYVLTESWERALYYSATHQDHLLLVPETQAQIGGWCRIFPNSGPESRQADLGIGIIKHYRRRGIGYALILRALDWANKQGYARLTLETFTTNLPALNLFIKVGFQMCAGPRRQIGPGERTTELIQLERIL